MRLGLFAMGFILSACTHHISQTIGTESDLPGLGSKHSTQMTAKECSDAGGKVIGDIGDGRTHRPDYVCDNGDMPLGTIVPEQRKPMPIEGAVCCGG